MIFDSSKLGRTRISIATYQLSYAPRSFAAFQKTIHCRFAVATSQIQAEAAATGKGALDIVPGEDPLLQNAIPWQLKHHLPNHQFVVSHHTFILSQYKQGCLRAPASPPTG